MSKLLVHPPRPSVAIRNCVYEVVEPETLREMITELDDFIYRHEHLPIEERHRWFTKAVLAAATNAMLDLDAGRSFNTNAGARPPVAPDAALALVAPPTV